MTSAWFVGLVCRPGFAGRRIEEFAQPSMGECEVR